MTPDPTPEVGTQVRAFRWGRLAAEWANGVVVEIAPSARGDWIKVVWDDGEPAEWVLARTAQGRF